MKTSDRKLLFKPAQKSDIPEVLEMMEAFYAIDHYPFNHSTTLQNLEEFIRNETLGQIWIAEQDGLCIGYFILTFGFSFEFKGRIALLDELYLKEEVRNSGIGRQILEFLLEEGVRMEVKTVLMEVEKHNKPAIHLYEKMGFKNHHRLIMSRPVANS
jgi:ribosomal protein S18 acetylase RimI-like enzyme